HLGLRDLNKQCRFTDVSFLPGVSTGYYVVTTEAGCSPQQPVIEAPTAEISVTGDGFDLTQISDQVVSVHGYVNGLDFGVGAQRLHTGVDLVSQGCGALGVSRDGDNELQQLVVCKTSNILATLQAGR